MRPPARHRYRGHLLGLLQADAMSSLIGFPQYILNASKLDDRYEEVYYTVRQKKS